MNHREAQQIHSKLRKKRKDLLHEWIKGYSGEWFQIYQPRGSRKT